MPEMNFRPNWISAPGQTIITILESRSISLDSFCSSIHLQKSEAAKLISGERAIDAELAVRISANLGSTPRFWLERERQFQELRSALKVRRPATTDWYNAFPTEVMRQMGWISKPENRDKAPSELMDFFGVTSVEEWREKYMSRLGRTNFRTSVAFENSVAATTAWLRRGELVAEAMQCGRWEKKAFEQNLINLKALSMIPKPQDFLPKLQRECAKHGVAVVVERCPSGCVASGATVPLRSGRHLLLLSARFLSDDHFWFSFFHEAGHIVLHGDEPSLEEDGAVTPEKEEQANAFAQKIILSPLGEEALQALQINKYAIARFAKKCCVSPGVIVGQLQNRRRISLASYNPFKTRYKVADFSLEMK